MSEGPRRGYIGALVAALLVGAVLRGAWPTSDPPTQGTVGIVWHDEGAWVHNARNRALWGTWRTDQWNPMFIAPVFTALEYGAFRAFGVGTWQARTVPAGSGLFAILMLSLGLAAVAGPRAAAVGAALLATNYVFVMWNRAALMESTMTAFIVASWGAYAWAQRRPAVGLLAGIAVILAWFTKASAAFFVAAIVLDAVCTVLIVAVALWTAPLWNRSAVTPDGARRGLDTWRHCARHGSRGNRVFVAPYWTEYRFYNWQMSVTRKPAYSIRALMDRASWIPIVHDFFTRMWLVTGVAALGIATVVARWRSAQPAERLLVLWVLLGLAELVVHDSGNERRYIMFIPALIGLFSVVVARRESLFPASLAVGRWTRWAAIPLVLLLTYIVFGSVARLAFLYQVRPAVRLSAALAVAATIAVFVGWRTARRLVVPSDHKAGSGADAGAARRRGGPRAVLAVDPGSDDGKLRRVDRRRPCARARHARPWEAGQRAVARKPDPPRFHRPRFRQLRRSAGARRCAIYFDVYRTEPRLRVTEERSRDPGRARGVPSPHHHHDL